MIDLYYWTTPNGHKITMCLEEMGLHFGVDYKIFPIDIGAGDQFKPEFLAISPNNRMPAIVDHAQSGGDKPFAIFESGAILLYLAEKTGSFGGNDLTQRMNIMQWLMWQMGGFGPMLGQNHHFNTYAPEKVPYAIDRYQRETQRLYGVLDKQLASNEFVAGNDYSIADMAIYPWAVPHTRQNIDFADYPHIHRWFEAIRARPATKKAYELADQINVPKPFTDEEKAVLFDQGKTNS
ncbi:MAG: glutathione binding-like protein [Alphaproteobacteria bacterium]